MGQYLPILVMFILGLGFAVSSLFMSRLVSPKRPSAAKAAPYECGIVPRQEPPERFPVRFYLVAMIFIVVDIEVIFLFPYAVVHERLGVFGLLQIALFVFALFTTLVYLVATGALEWGPVQRIYRRNSPMVSSARTSTTTIRRVGLEGREPAGAEVAA